MSTVTPLLVLELRGPRFLSQGDEALFFRWVEDLPCVRGLEGRGEVLRLSVDPLAVDEASLRELLALFWRYGLDMRQLARLELPAHAEWLRNPSAYWFESVFG